MKRPATTAERIKAAEAAGVTFAWDFRECIEDPAGFRASGDAAADAANVAAIRERIAAGDPWAWFEALCTARLKLPDGGTVEGFAALGACEYEDRADFLRCNGEDLKAEALSHLAGNLAAMKERGVVAARALAHGRLAGWAT